MVRVASIIIDDAYETIDASQTILDAAKKMKTTGLPDLIVVENEEVKGVITDYLITTCIVAETKDPQTTSVIDAMQPIPPVELTTSVEEALQRLQKYAVPVVPVVFKGELKGLVSVQDCWSVIPAEYWSRFEK